jgi:arylformamidase
MISSVAHATREDRSMPAPALDYEREYNNRMRVPEHADITPRWQAASAAYRQVAQAELDLPYGPKERHRFDLFRAGAAEAPLVVYIHGGYWQRGDRKDYSFVAKDLNAAGLDVALPSYTLCPAVSVMEIVAELRLSLAAIWQKTKTHPVVTGHSAGGHLTGAMAATDWSRIAGVPPDLVRAAVAISGVFDLSPLVGTSINDLVHLDAETARAASPLSWPPPRRGHAFVAAVGGDESSEFLRQSREVADRWGRAGVASECLVVPGTNHFTVVDELTKPASALFTCVARLARQAHAAA